MHDDHVDPAELSRACYEYGGLTGRAAWEAYLHYLHACPGCLEGVLRYYDLASFEELAALEDPGSELTRRARESRPKSLLALLDLLPEMQQTAQVGSDRRFHTAGLAKALLHRCGSRWGAEPKAALQDANLALLALGKIPPRDKDLPLGGVRELSALVWAYQGNVWRILADLRASEASFRKADLALAEGWSDELVPARVLQLKSSLLRAQRRFSWAMKAIDEAIGLYGRAEAWEEQGEALLVSAKLRLASGDPDAGLHELDRAAALLGRTADKRRLFVSINLRVGILERLSRLEEALGMIPGARELAERTGNRADPIRIRWCEARIALSLGGRAEAERLFQQVRQGFLELDAAYDVALVSLELAQLYAEQGRHGEVRRLASEMIPIFQSRSIHRETLAAVQLFSKAVQGEVAEREAITAMTAYLRDARHDPSLRFSL